MVIPLQKFELVRKIWWFVWLCESVRYRVGKFSLLLENDVRVGEGCSQVAVASVASCANWSIYCENLLTASKSCHILIHFACHFDN